MSYVNDRIVHDADSHIMEPADWIIPYADPEVRDRIRPVSTIAIAPNEVDQLPDVMAKHDEPAYRELVASEVLLHKNWHALGSFRNQDRPAALDALGFARQVVFNSHTTPYLLEVDRTEGPVLSLGVARAHNRAIADFCSSDPRLLAVAWVPLSDFETARIVAHEAIELGCAALMIPTLCPPTHSPSHVDLYPVWAAAQEASVPIVCHVGSGGDLASRMYLETGRGVVTDFHGGTENLRSVDFVAIAHAPMVTLAALIFDGVLDDFPRLKFGVMEQAASWVPGWMRHLDSTQEAFARGEERLRNLELRPSEYVQRQVFVTPHPVEDVGWIIEQAGADICMFSSDYPHIEGGRDPVGRFERSLGSVGDAVRDRFYRGNFEDLFGMRVGSASA